MADHPDQDEAAERAPGGGPSAPRSPARNLWPWLVGLGILAFLLARIPLDEVAAALAAGPLAALSLFAIAHVGLIMLADGWATHVGLAVVGLRRPLGTVIVMRGATYLLGLINYALGQGGVGWYLYRTGASPRRGAAAVVFLLVVSLGALAVLGGLGLAIAAPEAPGLGRAAAAIGAVLALYLALVARPPAVLRRWRLTAPLVAAGLGGHLRAGLARLPHLAVLIVGFWLAMRLWGVPVPLEPGLALMPIVLLVAALPIAPAGLGTTQAAQVALFAKFSSAPTAAGREADLLAFALAYFVVAFAVQLALGLACWLGLQRRGLPPPRGA